MSFLTRTSQYTGVNWNKKDKRWRACIKNADGRPKARNASDEKTALELRNKLAREYGMPDKVQEWVGPSGSKFKNKKALKELRAGGRPFSPRKRKKTPTKKSPAKKSSAKKSSAKKSAAKKSALRASARSAQLSSARAAKKMKEKAAMDEDSEPESGGEVPPPAKRARRQQSARATRSGGGGGGGGGGGSGSGGGGPVASERPKRKCAGAGVPRFKAGPATSLRVQTFANGSNVLVMSVWKGVKPSTATITSWDSQWEVSGGRYTVMYTAGRGRKRKLEEGVKEARISKVWLDPNDNADRRI